MKTNYFILIAFLLAITFSQVSSQSDNRVYCDPQPEGVDPSDIICTLEFNPVCGYSNSSDSEGVSGSNPCFACSQPGVDFYVLGSCPGDNGETENGEIGNGETGNNEEESLIVYCQVPDLPVGEIMCTLEYDPVCAYRFDTDGSSSGVTVGNPCQACSQDRYDYYLKGECPDNGNGGEEEVVGGDNGESNDQIIQCPTIDVSATDVICTLQYEPVCAYQEGDTNLTSGVTVGNPCQACQQQGFSFYTQGECGGDAANDEEIILNEELYPNGGVAVVCELPDLSATDILCVEVYEPVCAYFFNDTNEANGVTVSNACQACLLQGYEFYVQGECPGNNSTEVEEEQAPVEEQQPEEEQFPVEEQQPGNGGAGNEVGAAGLDSSASSTTRCDTPNQSASDVICTQEYEPVCAYNDNNPDSGTTVGNICQACLVQGYDYYVSGACE